LFIHDLIFKYSELEKDITQNHNNAAGAQKRTNSISDKYFFFLYLFFYLDETIDFSDISYVLQRGVGWWTCTRGRVQGKTTEWGFGLELVFSFVLAAVAYNAEFHKYRRRLQSRGRLAIAISGGQIFFSRCHTFLTGGINPWLDTSYLSIGARTFLSTVHTRRLEPYHARILLDWMDNPELASVFDSLNDGLDWLVFVFFGRKTSSAGLKDTQRERGCFRHYPLGR
jgi:hypothetical protein